MTNILEIHFLELSKFRKLQADISKPLDRWLVFLEPSSEEVLEMIKDQDPSIAKAEKILDWLVICGATKLSREEIEKIKQQMN